MRSAPPASGRGLLGDPVAGAGDDHGLHVVRGGLDPFPGPFTQLGAPPIARTGMVSGRALALLVLREGGAPGAIEPEAAAQGVGVGEEADVVAEGMVGQLLPALDGELVAEEDVLASPDEVFGQLVVDPVEGDGPDPVVERVGGEQGQ
jgi:hypothetical protein